MGKRLLVMLAVAAVAGGIMFLPATARAAAQNCPNPLSPGVTFGGTTIAVVALITPEGGIIHEVRAHTNFEIGQCPPIKGELTYQLQIKVRRHLRFVWVSTGTREKKDVGNLPPGTKFEMNSRRDCNPHGRASYRVRLHASPGINGDGSASPPSTRYLPVPKGRQKRCR